MEDEVSALESVLAFIEAYDVASIDVEEGSELPADLLTPTVRLGAASGPKEAPTKRRKVSRNRANDRDDGETTSYTTMLQRRKRAEVQTLREEVQELQAHLSRLQRARWGVQCGSKTTTPSSTSPPSTMRLTPTVSPGVTRLQDLWDSAGVLDGSDVSVKIPRPFGAATMARDGSKWLDSAVQQYRLRRRSELTNRQLKQLMSQQMRLNTSILRLMQKRELCPTLTQLLETPVSNTEPHESIQYRIADVEIESEITQLYREVDLVFDRLPADGSSSISCSLETKRDPHAGDCAEVRTTTPMQRSAASAAMKMWRRTCSNPSKHLNFLGEISGPDSYVKDFFLPLARRGEREGSDVLLNVRHHARKFDEADRFVMVMYAIVQLPVPGVHLREDSWTLVSPSPTDPKHESVIQSYYRIHAKASEEEPRPTAEAAEMCAFVMGALGRLTRRNMQTTQNWLLEEVSSPFPEWILT